jgi:regulator of protease activity HflC (stomatin/prohibitin superfamily)
MRKFSITPKNIFIGIGGLLVLMLLNSTFYTVEEGNVAIIKTWGEATEQVGPGLHFKLPLMHRIEHIEVRTRKNEESHPASSKEQMPLTVHISMNWTVQKESAMELYSKYGGLSQFESRIIDPKLRSASKSAVAKYTAEQLIVNRSAAIADITNAMLELMSDYEVSIDSVQIENIELPVKYLASIEAKQTAKNLADAEKHKLEQQKLQSQQLVNTAESQRDADKATADGLAYKIKTEAAAEAEAIRLKGQAEAEAMTAKAKAIAQSATLVEYEKALRWNGQMPSTVMGSDQNVLWSMGKN